MGALVAFATSAELARRGLPLPAWLGLSGRNGPQVHPPSSVPRTDKQLIATLRGLGGTPEELLKNPALRVRFLDTVRADFEVCDGFRPLPMPLSVPITAYYASDDPSTKPEAILTWSWWTTAAFTMRRFEGAHFFPFARRREFADTLAHDLARPETWRLWAQLPDTSTG